MQITIDIEKMTIGDLELLDKAARSELPANELIDFLDRIVQEDVRDLSITALPDITDALQEAVAQATNPETTEGN